MSTAFLHRRLTVIIILMLSGSIAASARAPLARGASAPRAESTSSDAALFHCQTCVSFGGTDGKHQFLSAECTEADERCFDCHSFNGCHPDLQEGSCFQFHNYCGATTAELDFRIMEAIKRQDIRGVRAMVAASQGALELNEERGIVQWLDCGGYVRAQLAVLTERAIAAR